LYDILRNEKKKEDLQKLEDTFFVDVVAYLKEKELLLGTKSESDELFVAGDKEKVEYELRSIKRILKELYDKREKKIIYIAMNKSRTGSDIIDTSSMLREENLFYDDILKTLNQFRKGILLNLFKSTYPNVIRIVSAVDQKKEEIKKELDRSFAKYEGSDDVPEPKEDKKESEKGKTEQSIEKTETKKEQAPGKTEPVKEKKKIRFIHPMPSFVWKDMKVYGPYNKGDETEIFPEVAELLVRKGRAEII